MQLGNIQGNLSKTELIQRLQQIMQDAARAAQAAQTPDGEERSRVAQEHVADTGQAENPEVREDERRRNPFVGRRRRRRRKGQDDDGSGAGRERRPPSGEGRLLDVVI